MKHYTLPPMHPELVVCPKPECGASGRIGVHSYTKRQYICHACKKTFAETTGTLLYDLKHPAWLVVLILALLSQGCPVPAIVFAFGLDERTVAEWQLKAGRQAKQVQSEMVCQGKLELGQVQADELYTKSQAGSVWIATAMTVFSRLWLRGAICWDRVEPLIKWVEVQVRGASAWGCSLFWAVDGLRAYPKAILSVFRVPLYTGRVGRPRLIVWDDLHIVQVVKERSGKRLKSVSRRVAYGCLARA